MLLGSGYFRAFFKQFPVEYAEDADKLAAYGAPKGMDPVLALEEAKGAIYDYNKTLRIISLCDRDGSKVQKEQEELQKELGEDDDSS